MGRDYLAATTLCSQSNFEGMGDDEIQRSFYADVVRPISSFGANRE